MSDHDNGNGTDPGLASLAHRALAEARAVSLRQEEHTASLRSVYQAMGGVARELAEVRASLEHLAHSQTTLNGRIDGLDSLMRQALGKLAIVARDAARESHEAMEKLEEMEDTDVRLLRAELVEAKKRVSDARALAAEQHRKLLWWALSIAATIIATVVAAVIVSAVRSH